MANINPYLFVYGTLMNRKDEPAKTLMKGCLLFKKAKLLGKLYDLGEYPGAVLSNTGEFYVYGDVVVMENPAVTLKVLDDYEGYGDDQQQPNLFVRKLVEVSTYDELLSCWVYLYNHSVEGAIQIVSGKY